MNTNVSNTEPSILRIPTLYRHLELNTVSDGFQNQQDTGTTSIHDLYEILISACHTLYAEEKSLRNLRKLRFVSHVISLLSTLSFMTLKQTNKQANKTKTKQRKNATKMLPSAIRQMC